MKILVTGATGFIGQYVVRQLLKHDCQVIGSYRTQKKLASACKHEKLKYIHCDLEILQSNFFDYFERPDILIHLSWDGLPNYNALFHFEKNLHTNYLFLKNLIQSGLRHVVVIGTCLEYGMQNGCLSEDMETLPSNSYALAKDTLRKFLDVLVRKYPAIFQWIRVFYIYGAGQSETSLLSQLDKALASGEKEFNMSQGEQIRDYLPVEKVARYIVKIALQKKVTGIINCCSGEPISIRKLVEDYICRRNGDIKLNYGYYPYPDYEPLAFWGDNRKLMTIIEEK